MEMEAILAGHQSESNLVRYHLIQGDVILKQRGSDIFTSIALNFVLKKSCAQHS